MDDPKRTARPRMVRRLAPLPPWRVGVLILAISALWTAGVIWWWRQ